MTTPASPSLAIDVVDTLGTVLVRVVGELDIRTAPELAAVLEPLRSRPCELDFVQVSFADSSGLNVLLRHRLQAEAANGSLRLVAASPPVRRLLDVAGVTDLLLKDPGPPDIPHES
ncbi:STAS domain-containing protein [Streptomyces sp. NPDC001663]|uniref:STAS domain-containing protein n=1 Tax=Streptomyces sp. NPDC001663 TaxID=3364597 RepID=UPI0036B4218E